MNDHAGIAWMLLGMGRLPGDVRNRRENFR
jgi:hypothetical protein